MTKIAVFLLLNDIFSTSFITGMSLSRYRSFMGDDNVAIKFYSSVTLHFNSIDFSVNGTPDDPIPATCVKINRELYLFNKNIFLNLSYN